MFFRRSIGAKPPHPTSLPMRRSWSSARPQSCSQTSSSHTFTAVELRRHRPRWRAFASSSPALLAASWSSSPCQTGSSCALGAHGEDLAVAHAVAAPSRLRNGGARCVHCRLLRKPRALPRALQSAEALCPGWPCWLVGRTSRPPARARQAMCSRMSQAAASQARTVRVGRARFQPRSHLKIKNSFSIFISVSN
jgi:hypothetical protein